MKTIAYKLTMLSALIVILGFGGSVYAEDAIDLEFNDGTNVNGGKFFNEDNVYPGWQKTEKLIVKNKSTVSDVDLYMVFDINNGKTLADVLKLYVIKDDTESYRVGGVGDRYTLKEAHDDDLYIGTLDPGEQERYKIKLTFDKDAGNEYQKLSTKFDIDFTIEGRTSESLTENQILAAQGRVVTGEAPADEEGEENEAGEASGDAVQQQGSDAEETGTVAGVATCHSWPLWLWIILLVGYSGLAYLVSKNTDQKETRAAHIFWQVLFAAITVLVWYFFETCRLYPWMPVITIIGEIVVIFFVRKKFEE